jgi:TolB protein
MTMVRTTQRRLSGMGRLTVIAIAVCSLPLCSAAGQERSTVSDAKAATEALVEDGPKVTLRLCVMDADGGNLRQLKVASDYTAFGSSSWLADGTKIATDAYKAHKGERWGNSHVVVIDPADGSLKDLGPGAMPSWSPEGNRIVFSQYTPERGVCVMYADGSGRQMLDPTGWGVRWSPDGTKLAWSTRSDGTGNIAIYDLIEGRLHTVLEGEQRRYSYIPQGFAWSPDSRRICFKGSGPKGPELAIVSVAGSSKSFKVRFEGETGSDIGWHPDGKHFLIHKRCEERNCLQLYSIEADSDQPPKLVQGQHESSDNSDGDWSRDGKTISFSSKAKKR